MVSHYNHSSGSNTSRSLPASLRRGQQDVRNKEESEWRTSRSNGKGKGTNGGNHKNGGHDSLQREQEAHSNRNAKGAEAWRKTSLRQSWYSCRPVYEMPMPEGNQKLAQDSEDCPRGSHREKKGSGKSKAKSKSTLEPVGWKKTGKLYMRDAELKWAWPYSDLPFVFLEVGNLQEASLCCPSTSSTSTAGAPQRSPIGMAQPSSRADGSTSDVGKMQKPCKFWQQSKKCKYGDRCIFSHEISGGAEAGHRSDIPQSPLAKSEDAKGNGNAAHHELRPTTGFANLEILCDGWSIFGNPFRSASKGVAEDTLRGSVCDACDDFMKQLLDHSQDENEPLSKVADEIRERHCLPKAVLCLNWMQKFGACTPTDFRLAVSEIVDLVEQRCNGAWTSCGCQVSGENMTRLVCDDDPKHCHIKALVDHIAGQIRGIHDQVASTVAMEIPLTASAPPHEVAKTATQMWLDAPADTQTHEAPSRPPTPPPPPLPPPPLLESCKELFDKVGTAERSNLGRRQAKQKPIPDRVPDSTATPPLQSTSSKGSGRLPRQPRRSPPWGERWGAAGIVALRRMSAEPRVCLVEKKNGRLGFPKGRAEHPDASPLDTAYREWREESMLPLEHLCMFPVDPFVDSWGCHYYFAEWLLADGKEDETWSVEDDPLDDDPIVCAHWLRCDVALDHDMLSKDRKQILQQALSIPASVPKKNGVRAEAPRRWRTKGSS